MNDRTPLPSLTAGDLPRLQQVSDARVDPTGAEVASVVAENYADYDQPAAVRLRRYGLRVVAG